MLALPRILEVQNLTGAVKAFDFSDEFPSAKLAFLFPENKVEGDKADIDVIFTSAEVPEFVSPGAPARNRKLMDRGTISVRMPYIKESFFINAEMTQRLREAGKETAQSAVAKLAEELEESTRRVHRGIELLKFKALSTSYQVVMDGRLVTIDSPYDSDSLKTTDWTAANADIYGDLTAWRRAVVQNSGRRLSHVLLNSNTAKLLYQNSDIRALLPGTSVAERMVMEGVEELRLYGLTWLVWDAFYVDPWDGTTKPYIEDNVVVLVPSSPDWSELQVGQVHYVNDSGNIVKDWGPVSWTEVVKNPVGVTVYVAWCGLAVVKVPKAVIIATVA